MSEKGIICVEDPQTCELCGAIAETRPYGPNGEEVCFPCGMKNEKAMERQAARHLFGEESA